MDPTDDLTQAQQDISDYVNGRPVGPTGATGPNAQAIAQAAQAYINSQRPRGATETSAEKEARQLDVQQAREDYQRTRDAANAMNRSSLQGQKDTAAGQRTDARDATSVQTTGMRDDTSAANTAARDTTSVQTTGMRDDTALATNAATNANRLDVANINVAGRLAAVAAQEKAALDEIRQRGQQQLDQAYQKYQNTKDLTAYTYEQQAIRNQITQEAMQARQLAVDAQKEAYNLPKQQADIAAEQARAKTEQQQADTSQRQQEQQARYQSANLQLSVAKDQSDQAKSAIDSGVKLGVAPPMELVKAQFAPFQMAQEVLKQLVDAGQIDHTRVPEALGITPSQPAGADQTSSAPAPLGQFSGYGTPGGYQGAPNPNIFGGAPEPGA